MNFVLVRPPIGIGMMALGLVYFVFLPSMVTTPAAGGFARRFGARRTIWGALALAVIGLPLLVAPSLAAVAVGLMLVGVGTFFAQAVATGFVGRAATANRGAASGMYLACYFGGGLVGSAVLGQVFDRFGWPACVLGIALALAAAAVLAVQLRVRGEAEAALTASLRGADQCQSGATRDPRLDFFRGLAMLIIFVAHVPGNSWTDYIPARFGFSSAAEMFVFCSGYASALAFGSVFVRRGWRIGTVRILYRIWQLYWAHIGLFLVLATISIAATRLHIGTRDYVADLSLGAFATDGLDAITGLMTLSLVPDLLNILPMYVVLLAFVPLAMALSRISPLLVVAASAALWRLVQATGLNLPAGGAAGRTWFFDPFAWQLMFFTGFAFGMGWLPKPRLNHPALLPIAAAAVALSVPINFWAFTNNIPELLSIHDWLVPDGIVATTRLDARALRAFPLPCLCCLEPRRSLAEGDRSCSARAGRRHWATVAADIRLERRHRLDGGHTSRRRRPRSACRSQR